MEGVVEAEEAEYERPVAFEAISLQEWLTRMPKRGDDNDFDLATFEQVRAASHVDVMLLDQEF